MKSGSQVLGFLAIPIVLLCLLYAAEIRPAYFTNFNYLGGVLLLEIVVVAVWHYEKWFFAILMVSFLWAGSSLPLSSAGSLVRWVFLGVGALVGLVKWSKVERGRHFSAIHLVALLCVLSAAVSSMVSNRIEISLLKSLSLFLLFLYCSCGARVAVAGRAAIFFRGFLLACEIVSYVSALCYLSGFEVYGNPNSLGAVMGVVIVPVLLWGVLIAEDRNVRQRRTIALCLASYLLLFSFCRAGILASVLASTVLCFVLRRQQLFLKGAFILVFLLTVIAVVQPARFDALVSAFTADLIYKGKPEEQGVFGSRKSPWKDTADVIRESPWFGSGFGTDMVFGSTTWDSNYRTLEDANREHGNSYLALLQYVGLAGVVPFAVLLFLVVALIIRACHGIRRTADPRNYALPLVLICIGGLAHAFFEDWLFAVGYFLTVFFWSSVFLLNDLRPLATEEAVAHMSGGSRVSPLARSVRLTANQFTSNLPTSR
ncbi:MAG TPA: O-antigen ligase family protein [Candidatus Sulfotelmatobacter sp.]